MRKVSARAVSQHIANGRGFAYVDIEIVFVLEVVGSKLSEAVTQNQVRQDAKGCFPKGYILSFVPSHDVGETDFVETSEEGERRED